ncbi:hypothetical protein [Planctomonas psychrotolerans]|uniref:hypothetical protein n=1 Tax=Planctomonas psychrotolerans TaxID=2528712 RepID=UPI00123B19F6|nr:hypothetical protein [Planctomonas psychrotolerans]
MNTDQAWFDSLAAPLQQHLWEHRGEPLSPEILVDLSRPTRPRPRVQTEWSARGPVVRLPYETWEYIWSRMSAHASDRTLVPA